MVKITNTSKASYSLPVSEHKGAGVTSLAPGKCCEVSDGFTKSDAFLRRVEAGLLITGSHKAPVSGKLSAADKKTIAELTAKLEASERKVEDQGKTIAELTADIEVLTKGNSQ